MMFYVCNNLIGGNGTRYDSTQDDASLANVDTDGNPGLFSVKENRGIRNLLWTPDNSQKPVYTISGEKIATPRKGINIIGGKKVIFK
jgi:hypothetical protein